MPPLIRASAAALLVAVLAPGPVFPNPGSGDVRTRQGEAASEQPLRARVSPYVAFAPAPVRIEAIVDPAEENRELEIVVDSDTYYRSSTIELSGAHAARTHRVEFPAVPAGTHDVVVVLRDRAGDVRVKLHHRVRLLEQ
jgi:hypothetical protein